MDGSINENINSYLKKRLESFEPKPIIYTYGTVSKAGDGVVRVTDLPGRRFGELLEFDNGVFGMVMELEENGTGAVLLSPSDKVSAGDRVRGTGSVASVPVGDILLGRVIDPLGRPKDAKPLEATRFLPVERPAHPIIERRPVDKPLQTGIIAIDSMVPIGRGQRELIIGDRQTGKTTIAVDTVLNQKDNDTICVYCAIGQKASSVAQVIKTLRDNGADNYTVVVTATAADSAAMQYLAPYAACSIAESFMEKGKDVLIIYDDLSKHAVAYRTMSLLLHRQPGREAYPGDVFYLHSRLLERSACLSKAKGGGSVTALPIVETLGGNISAYIPTNIISITDGQIYLETDLFHSGIRPAINTGLSVSRVGRSAQRQAMKDVSGTLRIDLAQYREMSVFARFGADLDDVTQRLLSRGELLTYLLVQQKNKTYRLSDMVVLLYAYSKDKFASVKPNLISYKSEDMLNWLRDKYRPYMSYIDKTGNFNSDTAAAIDKAIDKWLLESKDTEKERA